MYDDNDNPYIETARLNRIRDVIEAGSDPSIGDNSLIVDVSENGWYRIVEYLLLDPRVDCTVNDNDALKRARKNNHTKTANMLLRRMHEIELGLERGELSTEESIDIEILMRK